MTILWICIGWLAISTALGVLLGRAIALANDERSMRRIPDGLHGALIPDRHSSPRLRLVTARYRPPRSLPLHALATLAMLGGCAVPTAEQPHVTSSSGNSATVKYSGERANEADQKAREACAQSGKQAAQASTTSGATGDTVRSYKCTP